MLPIDPEGGWPLALARGLSVAALLSAFGALLFRGVVLPKLAGKVAPEEAARRVARLALASLVVAVPLLLVWAGLQTADLAQAISLRGPLIGNYSLLITANLAVWAWALLLFREQPLFLGTALLAYGFGLRHAVDADHIAAIDNVTRKLMQEGKRPVSVGSFRS